MSRSWRDKRKKIRGKFKEKTRAKVNTKTKNIQPYIAISVTGFTKRIEQFAQLMEKPAAIVEKKIISLKCARIMQTNKYHGERNQRLTCVNNKVTRRKKTKSFT